MPTEAVSLRRGVPDPLPRLAAERARAAAPSGGPPDVAAAQQVACDLGPWLPVPMLGNTLALWESLASLGAVDLTVARVAEPHLDALAILREARRHHQIRDEDWERCWAEWSAAGLWQVYAAQGPQRLHAVESVGAWTLEGPKPWCSLADRATHALVTAWIDDEQRGLFAIDLADQGVTSCAGDAGQSSVWAARGLAEIRSTSLALHSVPAIPVCRPQWYLTRPGFSWGGVGVAAIWYGGAAALARTLRAASGRRTPDQVALVHLGAVDTALARARAVLLDAAAVADDPETTSDEAVLTAQRARQVVADTVDEVLTRVGHALGPAPLTGDEEHARRVADLTVYLRQHHAERDLARQGELLVQDRATDAGRDPQAGWRWW